MSERFTIAAQVLAECGHSPQQIAEWLRADAGQVAAAVAAGGGAGGGHVRHLGLPVQQQLDDLLDEDEELCCPLTLMLFEDPHIASDGFIYDKEGLKQLLRSRGVSPMTRERLKNEMFPAKQRKAAALKYRKEQSGKLLAFANGLGPEHKDLCGDALERVADYLEVLKPTTEPTLARALVAALQKVGAPVPDSLRDFR